MANVIRAEQRPNKAADKNRSTDRHEGAAWFALSDVELGRWPCRHLGQKALNYRLGTLQGTLDQPPEQTPHATLIAHHSRDPRPR